MTTPAQIADSLGRKAIAEAIGVGKTAVSNAVVRGKFPPSWFLILSRMAADAGVDCPPSAFGMQMSLTGSTKSTNGEPAFTDNVSRLSGEGR